jgi:hypothetical protein
MNKISLKDNFFYFAIFIVAITISCVSFYFYFKFKLNHLPVFDAVMNEKNQLLSYLRFKNDFSLINRLYQVIYEFQDNPLSAGFGGILAFVAPSFLANDADIFLRTFFSVLFFLLLLYKYLECYAINRFDFILIILLLFTIQFIYNPENGITTYIPEISSGLFLISGYISCILFHRKNEFKWIVIGVLLMTTSILFRFNFFVYFFVFIFPFSFDIIKYLMNGTKRQKIIFISFFVIIFSIVFFYIKQYIGFFLAYYSKPVIYQVVNIEGSFTSFIQFCKQNIGFYGLLAYSLTFLLFQSARKQLDEKLDWKLVFPILFVLIFFFINMKATQPHIFSLILILVVISLFVNKTIVIININLIRFISCIVIVCSFFSFKDLNRKIESSSNDERTDMEVAQFLNEQITNKKSIQFVCFHREQLEIPLQVYFYRKNKVMMNQKIKFFFHDWNFYDIDKKLSSKVIVEYYIQNILKSIDFVVINKNLTPKLKKFKFASIINREIYDFITENDKFKQMKIINKDQIDEIIIYKVIKNE